MRKHFEGPLAFDSVFFVEENRLTTCTEQDHRIHILSDDFGGDQPYETTPSQVAQCPMNIHVHEIRH